MLGGQYSDRHGPRAPMLTGVGILLVGVLGCGTAPGIGLLVPGDARLRRQPADHLGLRRDGAGLP
jgi:MFS family permease